MGTAGVFSIQYSVTDTQPPTINHDDELATPNFQLLTPNSQLR